MNSVPAAVTQRASLRLSAPTAVIRQPIRRLALQGRVIQHTGRAMMAHAGRHVRTYAGTGDVRSDSKKEPAHAPESGTTKGYNAKPKNNDAGTTNQQHSAVDAANQQGSSQAPMAGATMDFDGNPTGGDVRSDSKNEPAHAPESGMTKGYNAKPTSDDAGPTNQQRSKLDSAGQQGNLQAPKAGATMDFDGSSTGGDIRSDSQQEPSYAPESGTTKGYNANPKSDDTNTATQQGGGAMDESGSVGQEPDHTGKTQQLSKPGQKQHKQGELPHSPMGDAHSMSEYIPESDADRVEASTSQAPPPAHGAHQDHLPPATGAHQDRTPGDNSRKQGGQEKHSMGEYVPESDADRLKVSAGEVLGTQTGANWDEDAASRQAIQAGGDAAQEGQDEMPDVSEAPGSPLLQGLNEEGGDESGEAGVKLREVQAASGAVAMHLSKQAVHDDVEAAKGGHDQEEGAQQEGHDAEDDDDEDDEGGEESAPTVEEAITGGADNPFMIMPSDV